MTDNTIQFDVRYPDPEGFDGCPSVTDYPEFTRGGISLVGPDRQITPLEDIQIKFSYPLSNDAILSFHRAGGFTLSAFWGAVYEGYARIYQDDGDPVAARSADHTRLPTFGKYGIWGHSVEDLFLEGFEEVEPGIFNLSIGS